MAETVTVDLSGNGDYTSIQDAINNSDFGDSIIVESGTYTENLLVNKSISIQSESGNPDNTVIMAADQEDDVIHVTADNVTICGFNITRENFVIEDSVPDYAYSGIFLDRVSNSSIIDNRLSYSHQGVFLEYSTGNILSNNTVYSTYASIGTYESSENTLINNNAFFSFIGIDVSAGGHNLLINNNIEYCDKQGIDIDSEHYTTATSNNISFCDNGIRVSVVDNSIFTDNIIASNNCSFDLYYSENLTISGNNASNNVHNGFYIYGCRYSTIKNNIISNNSEFGMFIDSFSNFNLVYNNYFSNTNNAKDACSNTWNITKTAGINIVGGPYLGGNFWASPNGTGFSQTHLDTNGDGICDEDYTINENNIDYLPLYIDEEINCTKSIIYSGTDLHDIIQKYGIYELDSKTNTILKCLEFNSSNFHGFYGNGNNNSTETLRIYEDSDLIDSTIPVKALEYKSTMHLKDFNATLDDYPYDGYHALNLFGEQYVSLSADSPYMITRLLLDSNNTYTVSTGESIDLGEGYTFRIIMFDVTGKKILVELHKSNERIEYGVMNLTEPNGTTWWCDLDIASEDEVIVFGVHALKNNSSSITIDGLWLTDCEHILFMECGDEFGNLEVETIDSNSVSMRNYIPILLERDTNVGIVNDISFDVLNTSNLSFQLAKGLENEFTTNSTPISMIYNPQSSLYFKGDVIDFEGTGFDFDGNITAYKWTSSIDGHLSDMRSFSTDNLTVGNHTIYFSVQDDSDNWSDEKSTSLVVGDVNININMTFESQFGGKMRNADVSGNYSCVAQGQNIIIVDISDPSNPREISRLPTSTSVEIVELAGNYAYIADNDLLIVNISNPNSPIIESNYSIESSITDVFISDTYAYVAFYDGLEILDISDPALPITVGKCIVPTYSISVNENYAYVYSDWKDNFSIINIGNPASPSMESFCNFPYNAQEIFVDGNYSYVAAGDDGLIIINISNPMSPEIVGICDTINDASDVSVLGNYAYVADKSNGLLTIDVSNPTKPTLISSYQSLYSSGLLSIDTSGNYAYSADNNYGFVIFDISNPTSPKFIEKYDTVVNLWNVVVSGDYAYTTTGADGFVVIDISNSTIPNIVSNSSAVYGYNHVAISGNYAYVEDGSHGVMIIDISNPENVTYVSKLETKGSAYDVIVSGSYAYVADTSGLLIFDVSNPLASKLVGSYETDSNAVSVSVLNDYAYVIARNGILNCELFVIDITNPITPLLVGNCDVVKGCSEIATYEDYVYLTSSHNGLVTVDATDPTNPFILHESSSLRAEDIVVSDGELYVASPGSGLVIINITNPELPSIIGNYDDAGSVIGVDVSGNHAYLTNYHNGLIILNTENLLESETSQSSTTTPTTSSSSGSSGSGGGSGGGTSGELYENIAFKDVKSEFVTKDSVTKYDFDSENNEVEFIQFTASRNWGKISATIECLHDTSALVDKEPEGTVYRNLNIWVGKSGFSDSDNIEDCMIGFKVSRQWFEENDIDEGSIRLLHYSEGEWEKLDTKLTDKSDEYLHFEAGTSGFSPFAIVGDSEEKTLDSDETKMSTDSVESNGAVGEENVEPVSNNTPAFESITAIAAFVLAVCCISLRKRERS